MVKDARHILDTLQLSISACTKLRHDLHVESRYLALGSVWTSCCINARRSDEPLKFASAV
jgi:hypothetical protein